MALPIIAILAAAAAGTAGVAAGVSGVSKMSKANDRMKNINSRHERNLKRQSSTFNRTTNCLDELGKLEFDILASFKGFADLIEYVQGRPEFKTLSIDGIELPKYNHKELEQISIGANAIKATLGGAAIGTAGGLAAAGATTAAVAAVGTAGTGVAISTLSGAAATNATLAALGGGTLAAGGGGMALGTAVLGASTLGVGLLVGGVIFNVVGDSVSEKADTAEQEMLKTEIAIDKICNYLNELRPYAKKYKECLERVNAIYRKTVNELADIILHQKKVEWSEFNPHEKMLMNNAVDLVALLRYMCKVKLVEQTNSKDKTNSICKENVDCAIARANTYLESNHISA